MRLSKEDGGEGAAASDVAVAQKGLVLVGRHVLGVGGRVASAGAARVCAANPAVTGSCTLDLLAELGVACVKKVKILAPEEVGGEGARRMGSICGSSVLRDRWSL